jgi:hypothetical protein
MHEIKEVHNSSVASKQIEDEVRESQQSNLDLFCELSDDPKCLRNPKTLNPLPWTFEKIGVCSWKVVA